MIHEPSNSVPQVNTVEIDQQPDFFVCKFKVGEQLRFVHLENLLHDFQLHDDAVFNKQVYLVAALNFYTVVHYG